MPSRRFWAPTLTTCRLCPSMDLLVVKASAATATATATASKNTNSHNAASSPPLTLYRTVLGGQKLALIAPPEYDDDAGLNDTNTIISDNSNSNSNSNNTVATATTVAVTMTHAAWRPDGRLLACGDNKGRITLQSVEALLSSGGGSLHAAEMMIASAGASSSSSAMMTEQQAAVVTSFSVAPPTTKSSSSVSHLHWAHVGRPHPLWELSDQEQEDFISWQKYQVRFCDRQAVYLPPSQYHHLLSSSSSSSAAAAVVMTPQQQQQELAGASALPNSQTPLSVLYVVVTTARTPTTTAKHEEQQQRFLQAYLHGCYPILRNIPLDTNTTKSSDKNNKNLTQDDDNSNYQDLQMVASTDLSHVLIRTSPSTIALYGIPALSSSSQSQHFQHNMNRTLQILSSLYSTTQQRHLTTLQHRLTEIAASWKSSIKPLDIKLDALTRLFQNYGLVPSDTNDDNTTTTTSSKTTTTTKATAIRRLLVQYILSGHTRAAPNLANAMDQFFTGVQMNDQLMQRMEASLTVAVANVEIAVKQFLVAPAQAAVYQVVASSQLLLAATTDADATMDDNDDNNNNINNNNNNSLISAPLLLQWQEACQDLFLQAQALHTALVEARFRLRDWIAWLRSASAQVKARGTAPQSARHDNARKRRVPHVVVQRLLQYLQQQQQHGGDDAAATAASTNKDSKNNTMSTSSSSVTENILQLQFGALLRPDDRKEVREPLSPTTAAATATSKPCSLAAAIRQTQIAGQAFLEGPLAYFQDHVTCKRIQTTDNSNKNTNSRMAMTMRLGCGGIREEYIPFGEPPPDGFFCPAGSSDARDFRQWAVLAKTVVGTVATPDEADNNHSHTVRLHALPLQWAQAGLGATTAWTVDLHLPRACHVVDLAFYQDDGKSSLSSGQDSGIGKEGSRQALGVLVQQQPRQEDQESPNVTELWLIPYDHLIFDPISLSKHEGLDNDLSLSMQAPESKFEVRFVEANCDEIDADDALQEGIVYARTRTLGELEESRLVLSGSRGMAAVYGRRRGVTVLELLDVEEDEELEENEDEEMEATG